MNNPNAHKNASLVPESTVTCSLEGWLDRIHTGDCMEVLGDLPAGSVDLVFADLPYGVTRNAWDVPLPLPALWDRLKEVLTPAGVVVMTATQPFAAELVLSNRKWFKYDQIWVKTIGSNQTNISHQPLRVHESVLVFYARRGTYNPQRTTGTPYRITRKASTFTSTYGTQRDHEAVNTGTREPRTVLEFANPRVKNGHPSAKPVALVEHFIKTFTNPGDVVLDPVIGGGSSATAAVNLDRRFIGIEKDHNFAAAAQARITDHLRGKAS